MGTTAAATTATEKAKTLHTVEGGGTRSEKAAPFHLVPREGSRRTALRFGLGAETHGAWNWTKSCETEAGAAKWCQEAYNHLMEHALKLGVSHTLVDNLTSEDSDDDHLGAIGWAVHVIAYCEEKFNKPWTQLK